jgi:hypothetical protein
LYTRQSKRTIAASKAISLKQSTVQGSLHVSMSMLFESTHLACRALTYLANTGPPHLFVQQTIIDSADVFDATTTVRRSLNDNVRTVTTTKASPLRHVADAIISTNLLCELAVMITMPHAPILGVDDVLYRYQLEAYRLLQR